MCINKIKFHNIYLYPLFSNIKKKIKKYIKIDFFYYQIFMTYWYWVYIFIKKKKKKKKKHITRINEYIYNINKYKINN